jgi:hypothetical protein
MGTFDSDKYIQRKSEAEIKHFIQNVSQTAYNKTIQENDWNSILEYLKIEDIFITSYICNADYENARQLFVKIINAFNITAIDIDTQLKFIRDNGKEKPVRYSSWEFYNIPLVNNKNKELKLGVCKSKFKNVNNWGNGATISEHKIVYNNMKVIWIKNDYRDPELFLLNDDEIYGLTYKNKYITVYYNISVIKDNVEIKPEYKNIDEIIVKYDYERNKCDEYILDLTENVEKKFFYKGIKWNNYDWLEKYYPNDRTRINDIYVNDGYFCIEIENITYNNYCYNFFLDIKNHKIVEVSRKNI